MEYTEDTIKEIASKSLINSASLISDAELLFDNGRYERAYTLYQLGMEEAGKAVACALLLINGLTKDKITKFKQEIMRSHEIKTKNSSYMDIYVAEHFFKKNWDGALNFINNTTLESTKELNTAKNNSLYTTIIDGIVKIPKDTFGIKHAKMIQFKAVTRYSFANAWVSIGLKHLEEIKQYLLENPLEDINGGKSFWRAINED